MCTANAISSLRRTFQPLNKAEANELSTIPNPYAAAFFDFDEDGTSDVFVLTEEGPKDNITTKIYGIFNNINYDAYFFKTLGTNGICTQWCSGNVIPNPKPFGVNQYGTTVKYTFADLNGKTHAVAVPQLSQSAHLALQTPYNLNGLGRPSNYITYFYMGVPIKSSKPYFYTWTGLIPNSQIVAIPYPPEDPENWRPELYLSPSGKTLWIFIAVIVGLLGMGGLVGFFTYREKKQDEKEKKEGEFLFSFKAL